MQNSHETSRIRNISFIAHVDAGKTSLSEQILFHTGKTHCAGSIDDGTTVLDYLDEERKRGITIVSAAATVCWKDHFLHLIDTPGHMDFTAEVERSLRVIDGTVVIFSAVEGVEAQSEKVWYQADKYDIPRLVFINKLDRLGADFSNTVTEINKKLGCAIPIQYPVGIEDSFSGIIDLITMNYHSGEDIDSFSEIPETSVEQASIAREEMIIALSDISEKIAELYLNEQKVPEQLLKEEIRRLTTENSLIPIICGSAKKDIGTEQVLDAIIDFLPSPDEKEYSAVTKSGKIEKLSCSTNSQFCGFVFKISADKNRELIYLRTYSGQLKAGDTIINSRTGGKIKIKHLMRLYANSQEKMEFCGPGDIIGLCGIKDIATGDTLCGLKQPLYLDSISFPPPVLSMAIEPRKAGGKDKLLHILDIICREDPTLFYKEDEETGQFLISGMGELHLEVIANRINDEFNLEIRQGAPKVSYREMPETAITETIEFQRTAGERQLWGKVTLSIEPDESELNPLMNYQLENSNLSNELIEEAKKTLRESVITGGLNGCPLIHCKVSITDIELNNHHYPAESLSPAVFYAFDQILRISKTVMMEPLMEIEAITPSETTGEVINYLQSRKAEIKEIRAVKKMERITAIVPLDQMFGFGKAMPKLTAGRGSFSMIPSSYRPCEIVGN